MIKYFTAHQRHDRRKRLVAILLAWILSALTSVCAVEQSSTDLLQALASESYETRERATETLYSNDDITLETIQDLFAQAQSPEQRHRLLAIAEHHVLKEIMTTLASDNKKGALGITHRPVGRGQLPELKRAAVVVISTLPGFPAHGIIRAGDLILAIEDEPIPINFTGNQVTNRFIEIVRKHAAGESIKLEIMRHNKQRSVQIKLSNLAALEKMYVATNVGLNGKYQRQVNRVVNKMIDSIPEPTIIPTPTTKESTND